MKNKCYFCHKRKQHTEVWMEKKKDFVPICFLCNKMGVHLTLQEKWQTRINEDWIYDTYKDVFMGTGKEISRLMLPYIMNLKEELV